MNMDYSVIFRISKLMHHNIIYTGFDKNTAGRITICIIIHNVGCFVLSEQHEGYMLYVPTLDALSLDKCFNPIFNLCDLYHGDLYVL